ncbi:MAG: ExbD/TolR family protein [Myxococcota bacterium]
MAEPPPEEKHGATEGETASMAQVKQLVRQRLRRQPELEENFLNIYPMMDMMTILLVFMVMQFSASSAAAIQESDALRIPYSTSPVEPEDALPLQIARDEISVDGEHIIPLRSGQVDPSHKQGGGTGFLITPLFKQLEREAKRDKIIAANNPQRPFEGAVQIVADKRTPYRTLAEVVYTLGQAEYKALRFVANKRSSMPPE